jgi:hypothetical protein
LVTAVPLPPFISPTSISAMAGWRLGQKDLGLGEGLV